MADEPIIERRKWNDLSEDEQARIRRLLTPDPDDNLDDLVARCERAVQIIRGTDRDV